MKEPAHPNPISARAAMSAAGVTAAAWRSEPATANTVRAPMVRRGP